MVFRQIYEIDVQADLQKLLSNCKGFVIDVRYIHYKYINIWYRGTDCISKAILLTFVPVIKSFDYKE